MTSNGNGHRKRGRGVRALIPDLAEGSHQGNTRAPVTPLVSPDDARLAMKALDNMFSASTATLQAELDLATTLLRQLERVLTRQGGYMLPEDQDALRSARAFLVDRAK